MSDTRARVTPTKPINLAQLDREMGGVGLSAALDDSDAVIEVVAPEPVALSDLQAAADAHAAEFPPDPDDEFRKAVEAATSVADLKAALLGTAGPGAEPRRP